MQLPTLMRPSTMSIPPLYTWPRSLKRMLLSFAVLLVLGAYLLLGGGLIALLALVAEQMGR